MDPDTNDEQLVYEITTEPKHGFIESKLKPGTPITTFTQGTEVLHLLRSSGDDDRITPVCKGTLLMMLVM